MAAEYLIGGCILGRDAAPDDDATGLWVAGCYAVQEALSIVEGR